MIKFSVRYIRSLSKKAKFEWDQGNQDKNWKKHGVSTDEAESVFIDKHLICFESYREDTNEKRYVVIGMGEKGRRLLVAFTLRKGLIRIISARGVKRQEILRYEEKTNNSKF